MELVVDSCVIISGLIVSDVNYPAASKFLHAAGERGDGLLTPATLLWDVSARFDHPEKSKGGSLIMDDYVVTLRFVDVTADLFRSTQGHAHAASNDPIGLQSSIRGPDLVFVSCALANAAPLVTWDGLVRKQADLFGVAVITPEEYVAGIDPGTTIAVPSKPRFVHEVETRFGRTR
jgi:hypothetical protein